MLRTLVSTRTFQRYMTHYSTTRTYYPAVVPDAGEKPSGQQRTQGDDAPGSNERIKELFIMNQELMKELDKIKRAQTFQTNHMNKETVIIKQALLAQEKHIKTLDDTAFASIVLTTLLGITIGITELC